MNTTRKEVKRVRGDDCEHVFLIIDGNPIRVAERYGFRVDQKDRGGDVTAKCPVPRCGGNR